MQGTNIVSAVFDNYGEAERAVQELRSAGVDNSAISIIGKHDGDRATETTGSGEHVDSDEPSVTTGQSPPHTQRSQPKAEMQCST